MIGVVLVIGVAGVRCTYTRILYCVCVCSIRLTRTRQHARTTGPVQFVERQTRARTRTRRLTRRAARTRMMSPALHRPPVHRGHHGDPRFHRRVRACAARLVDVSRRRRRRRRLPRRVYTLPPAASAIRTCWSDCR